MHPLEKKIQKELDLMEGGLFLDKEWDRVYGTEVFSIKHLIDGNLYTALEWRWPDGSPRPLSEELIITLRSQEGSIVEALKTAMVNNAARKELILQEKLNFVDELAHEFQHEKRGKRKIYT